MSLLKIKNKKKKKVAQLHGGRVVPKPILAPGVEQQCLDAIAMFTNRIKWVSWGMRDFRDQGSSILLRGPTGTGKTVTARWLAQIIGNGFKKIEMAALSSDGSPGSIEKSIKDLFADCRERGNITLFIDECDGMLGNRKEVSDDTWMVTAIETFMMELNVYPGQVICATNNPEKMDPALASRFLAIIDIDEPDVKMRHELWKTKWPSKFPMQPTEGEISTLAEYELNGRQIENVFINTASHCIKKSIKPSLKQFITYCKLETHKKLTA